MKTEIKQRLLNYLENGGSEEERQSLIKKMNYELGYVDIDCMSICTDDSGCANLTNEQLHEVVDKMEDRLMEDFNNTLGDVLYELGY